MAGIQVTVQVDDDAFRNMMDAIIARGRALRPAMLSISEEMLRSTKQRFTTQRDPDGQPWTPLSSRYAERKQGPKILTERGNLRRINYRASNSGTAWGTNRIYGAIHQLGGTDARPMPARPYLGINAADRGKITEILTRHLTDD